MKTVEFWSLLHHGGNNFGVGGKAKSSIQVEQSANTCFLLRIKLLIKLHYPRRSCSGNLMLYSNNYLCIRLIYQSSCIIYTMKNFDRTRVRFTQVFTLDV